MATNNARDLPSLGLVVRRARESDGLSQKAFADKLRQRLAAFPDGPARAKDLQQSYIARLEAGAAVPGREVLEAIAAVLDVPYDELLAALIRDRYAQKGREEIFYPLEKGIVTLEALAKWEAEPEHREIWLVTEKYLDDQLRDFREAVKSMVKRGGRFVFIVPRGFAEEIDVYRDEIAEDLGRPVSRDELKHIPLTTGHRGPMAAAFVLASNVGLSQTSALDAAPSGYLILSDGGGNPYLGIRFSPAEARARLNAMKAFLREFDQQHAEAREP